jgi:ribokinase
MSCAIVERLAAQGIRHEPIVVPDRQADWTLLVTSGPFGDKLPIGFRGCHAAIESLEGRADRACDLRVVASLPNRLAAEALWARGARVRMFAPAMRNMVDRTAPISRFTEAIDILCCNRHEWESLEDREQVAWQVSILVVTDGSNGSIVRFMLPSGEPGRVRVAAFPRARPPKDTNRAGEAYASTLVSSLLDAGWTPGVAEEELIRTAATRAAAAAALVLDRERFGFPGADEIDAAIRQGRVG